MPTSLATAELEARDTGVLLRLDGTESSWIDLRDPAHLDFEYQQQMNAVVDVLRPAPAPLRAVHLGGAACALARAWDALRPGSTQLAVEIDEVLALRVRQWFDLPRSPRLRIRVADAAQAAHAREVAVATGELIRPTADTAAGSLDSDRVGATIDFLGDHGLLGDRMPQASEVCVPLGQ